MGGGGQGEVGATKKLSRLDDRDRQNVEPEQV